MDLSNGAGGSSDAFVSGSRVPNKRCYTPKQVQELEEAFTLSPNPNKRQKRELAEKVGLNTHQIENWFGNRRSRQKATNEHNLAEELKKESMHLAIQNDMFKENYSLKKEREMLIAAVPNLLRCKIPNLCFPHCAPLTASHSSPVVGNSSLEGSLESPLMGNVENTASDEMNDADMRQWIDSLILDKPDPEMQTAKTSVAEDIPLIRANEDFTRLPDSYSMPPEHPMKMSMPEKPMDVDNINNAVNESSAQPIASSSLHLNIGHSPTSPEIALDMLLSYKPAMMETARCAMKELIVLANEHEPVWHKAVIDKREALDEIIYERAFKGEENLTNPKNRRESSRYSGLVVMDALKLTNMFMDPNKWMQCFPGIVVDVKTIAVLNAGMEGNPDEVIKLMSHVSQVLSPLVPVREIYFLRYCKEIKQGSWAVVDVSLPTSLMIEKTDTGIRKLPSGFLIQDSCFGCTKVTWMEHIEIEDKCEIHDLFGVHIRKGIGFGAERWVSCLQRTSERIDFLPATCPYISLDRRINEVILSRKGRKNILALSLEMVNKFLSSINPCNRESWSIISRSDNIVVRVCTSSDNGATGLGDVVVSALTSLSLELSPNEAFDRLRNEHIRPQWDALFADHTVKEIANMRTGLEAGNWVTIFKDYDIEKKERLILQESSKDNFASVIVYSPVDMETIYNLKTAEEPQGTKLLSSGIAIIPPRGLSSSAESSSLIQLAGSIVTLGFQVSLRDLGVEGLNMATIEKVKCLLEKSVFQLKSMMEESSTHS